MALRSDAPTARIYMWGMHRATLRNELNFLVAVIKKMQKRRAHCKHQCKVPRHETKAKIED